MNSIVKTRIIWGGIALVACLLAMKSCSDSQRREQNLEDQKSYRKANVTPILKEVNEKTAPREEQAAIYDGADLLSRLGQQAAAAEALRREAANALDYLRQKQGEQPEAVCNQWRSTRKVLDAKAADLARHQQEAHSLFDEQRNSWLQSAAREQAVKDPGEELKALAGEMEERVKAIKKRLNSDDLDEDEPAYLGYQKDKKRLERRIKLVGKLAEDWKRGHADAAARKAEIITPDGQINENGEPIRKAEELLAQIDRGVEGYPPALAEPTLLPAPPPPPFKPDLRIVATGDLAESLLEPLVNQWLGERKATPVEGSSFTWNMPDEQTREIAVKVPQGLQGAEPGVLKIRICTEPQSATVFSHLFDGGDADLVLTGRKMGKQQEALWLPQGKTLEMLDPQGKGRAYRTRVCSDALIFFRGLGQDLDHVSAKVLTETPKLFSMDDDGRVEAAALFALRPQANDKRAMTGSKTSQAVCAEYPDCIFMGTWHRDGVNHSPGRALSASGGTSLGYSTCWEDAEALKNIPPEYKSVNGACLPTDDTINSGEYAFSYNITFYRSTRGGAAAAALDLMQYASDVGNKEVEELVRIKGFAPLQFQLDKPHGTLTEKDLPLALVIRELDKTGTDFGYDADTTTWVYGVRIPIPLYYEVGSTTSGGAGAVAIDPDSRYYTESQGLRAIGNLVKNRQACLVLVGHADPQWQKKMDVTKLSWSNNLHLSQERAQGVYNSLFKDVFPEAASLKHVTLGVSWARPACDLDLHRPVEEQETALGRCRKADIFLVFPLTDEQLAKGGSPLPL